MTDDAVADASHQSSRRVVIGRAGDGRSSVIIDEIAPPLAASRAYPGVSSATIWKEPHVPDIASTLDHAEVYREVAVPDQGTRFYIVTIGPGARTDMHTTTTIEYHTVISGSVTCVLEHADVDVSAGDVLVMRGVPHGWRNDGDEPFVSVAVMVDAALSFDDGH